VVASRDGGTWTAGTSQPSRLEFSTTADGAASPTERLRITAAGRVGIGTSSPGSIFHAAGNGAIGIFQSTTAGQNAQVNFQTTVGTWSVGQNINLTNTGALEFSYGGIKAVLDSSGRLGIGTASPGTPLNVQGIIRAQRSDVALPADIRATQIGCESGEGSLDTVGNGAQNIALRFRQSSDGSTFSERARFDTSGRFLVGTSTSTSNIRLGQKIASVTTGDYAGASFTTYSSNPGHGTIIDLNRSKGTTDGTLTSVANNDLLGNIHFRGSDGSNFVNAATISAEVDGTPGTNDMPGRLVFSTTADGASSPTERMRITNAGIVYAGTTSADGGAHVFERNAPGSYAFRVTNSNTNNGVATNGIKIVYPSVTPSDTNAFLACVDSTNNKATIRNNGGLANYSANNVVISPSLP
jgi:hypothetical protein